MPNTTNFNWPTPADTDLVKDGAAAIRNLGNGIDTSLIDLKGGTTGQILSKASNADMDFTFINPNVGDITEVQAGVGISVASGTGPIPIITNSSTDLITTAGDLLYGTAADTVARLGIGTAGQLLAVNSGATAPEWVAAPSSGSLTLLSTTTLSGASTSISVSATGYTGIRIVAQDFTNSGGNQIFLRINSDNLNNYFKAGLEAASPQDGGGAAAFIQTTNQIQATQTDSVWITDILNSEQTDCFKLGTYVIAYKNTTGVNKIEFGGFSYLSTSAITNIAFHNQSTQTFSGGTVKIYGVK